MKTNCSSSAQARQRNSWLLRQEDVILRYTRHAGKPVPKSDWMLGFVIGTGYTLVGSGGQSYSH